MKQSATIQILDCSQNVHFGGLGSQLMERQNAGGIFSSQGIVAGRRTSKIRMLIDVGQLHPLAIGQSPETMTQNPRFKLLTSGIQYVWCKIGQHVNRVSSNISENISGAKEHSLRDFMSSIYQNSNTINDEWKLGKLSQ